MSTEPSEGAPSVSTPATIPHCFVWPHGGQRVCLCGSFTRWQNLIPMLPVEGCPSVFQVVCNLVPGYYQYRFVVDNKWKYDEQQPSVADSLGNYNFVIVGETGQQGSEGSSAGGNMELDRDMLVDRGNRVPSVSMRRLSLEDAGTSRQLINEFLLNHTAYEMLPDLGKVVAIDITLAVKKAFHILYDQGIPVAPLWDSNMQQFVGMLTASDFISVLMQIGNQRAMLSEEELETHTIAAWKEGKRVIANVCHSSMNMQPRSLFFVGPDDTLKEVTRKILYHQVTTVPVLHFPTAQGQSLPELLHLATLSCVLKCMFHFLLHGLCQHFRHSPGLLSLLTQPIGSLPLGTWRDNPSHPLVVLKQSAPLSTALETLMQEKVSAIPIVDDNGSLLDIYARSDITALARDNTYVRMQLDQLTIEQALRLVHDGTVSAGTAPVLRCQMCLRTEQLLGVLERLSTPGVRRIICVEPGSRKIEGIVTLTDVFRFLVAS